MIQGFRTMSLFKMKISYKNKFYLSLLLELILSPWEYIRNFVKWNFGNSNKYKFSHTIRKPIAENKLAVCVHEWGGYNGKRLKKIKNIPEFECGLDYQLNRFQNYKGKYELDLTITISDSHLLETEVNCLKTINVSNIGMDFSGYEAFYESIKNMENQYVILTNSSVNKLQIDFIDDYLDFFKNNTSIGMLGISFNPKMYQSFIRNNFNPHLQSFFLLTTTEILKEVVTVNKKFPGKGIDHKLALIKFGEIKLSKNVMDLGYKLCCILENGKPFLFDKNSFSDNGRSIIKYNKDSRLTNKEPNSVNQIIL